MWQIADMPLHLVRCHLRSLTLALSLHHLVLMDADGSQLRDSFELTIDQLLTWSFLPTQTSNQFYLLKSLVDDSLLNR